MSKGRGFATCAFLLLGLGCADTDSTEQVERAEVEALNALNHHFSLAASYDAAMANAAPLVEAQGWAIDNLKWEPPKIPVCWESLDTGHSRERLWVTDALERSWEAHSAVDFTGWNACPATSLFNGIRVAVTSGQAETNGTGREVLGTPNGVKLNFTFAEWNANPCRQSEALRESCVRATAVHEFGHALGFVHEHNRHETWQHGCNVVPDDRVGDIELTAWDANSVMNYCNGDRLRQAGRLSDLDKLAVERFYGNEI